jgi:DnaJ-class molecular chaperone
MNELHNICENMNIDAKLKILNVNRESSIEEIKRSYRVLILKYHPDKREGSNSDFIRIKTAYDDVMKWKTDTTVNFFLIIMFYINFLKENVLIRKKDIILNLEILIEELYNNSTKKISYNRQTKTGKKMEILYLELKDWKEQYIIPDHGDYDILSQKTTNLIINIEINNNNFKNININTLLDLHELYLMIDINIYEYYFGVSRCIPYFNDEEIEIRYNPYDTNCLTQIIKGKGLEYEGERKDLIISYNVDMSRVHDLKNNERDIKRIFDKKE